MLSRIFSFSRNVFRRLLSHSCQKTGLCGYQQFLLFLQCFQKPSVSGLLKVGIMCSNLEFNS